MPADKFQKITSGDEALDRVQGNIATALDPVLQHQLLRGQRVDVAMDANQVVVPHGLGREPLGWIVMTPSSSIAGLYEDRTLTPDRTKVLVLRDAGFTVPLTFSLWVF